MVQNFRPAPCGLARWALILLVMLASLSFPSSVMAQSVPEIMTRAMERNGARLAQIQNLRIQQEVMGISMTTYFVKEIVDGTPILRPHSVQASGIGTMGQQSLSDGFWTDSHQMYSDWADWWRLEGRGSVQGAATYRLVLDRFDGLDLGELVPDQAGRQMAMTKMTMDLEVDRLVPLAMFMEGTMTEGGQTRPIAVNLTLSEYREVSGYLYPAMTSMKMDVASSGITPEQMAEARRGMEEMQRQLAQMPEAQRRMMEQMMGGQMANLQQMFTEDGIQVQVRVTDVQANVTLP